LDDVEDGISGTDAADSGSLILGSRKGEDKVQVNARVWNARTLAQIVYFRWESGVWK
jgi:hypothetical protein